ncbi:MAG: deoxyhypusine synthase family protein, partial [Deltaproteobacteria bacterium]|nr:deoxyhypusine synthase family protein [Deltaproteobacteria bacterium]
NLGEAVDVAEAMICDETFVVLTLSGAMTMAGMNPLIIEMIERGWVHCIVATGALVGHGLVEDLGMPHYKHKVGVSDEDYYKLRLNRVYDVLEPEANLDALELRMREFLRELAEERIEPLATHELLRLLGEKLGGRGVLQAAAAKDVPVIIPAFTDSELGLDFAVHQDLQRGRGLPFLRYDAFADLNDFCRLCQKAQREDKKLGIFTIGGGVPRNWAQQVGPYVDVRNHRLGLSEPRIRYTYALRICPDPAHYGHLSGCTYSEGVSWGKFVPAAEGGRFAEVLLDATVGWPLITRALIERGL